MSVYYASQILFPGPDSTQGFARLRGKPIEPAPNAVLADACDSSPQPAHQTPAHQS